eukprot:1194426-Prorocentrum_minimum.AAC.2
MKPLSSTKATLSTTGDLILLPVGVADAACRVGHSVHHWSLCPPLVTLSTIGHSVHHWRFDPSSSRCCGRRMSSRPAAPWVDKGFSTLKVGRSRWSLQVLSNAYLESVKKTAHGHVTHAADHNRNGGNKHDHNHDSKDGRHKEKDLWDVYKSMSRVNERDVLRHGAAS